jgi:transposase-like protein
MAMARRTRDEWREVVARQEQSGLNVSKFCRRDGVTENSFYRWRRVLADESEARFIPLSIVGRMTVDIELPCGATVKVAADRASLREVFGALLRAEAGDA